MGMSASDVDDFISTDQEPATREYKRYEARCKGEEESEEEEEEQIDNK